MSDAEKFEETAPVQIDVPQQKEPQQAPTQQELAEQPQAQGQGQGQQSQETITGEANITDDAEKLKALNAQVAQTETEAIERKEDIDGRSIYVGNVDYEASPEELQRHFQEIGPINRVTILLNKFTGKPKGFAYIEFAEPASVVKSLSLNDSVFRNRNLKVVAKRTNIPGFNSRGRGGFRGRGAPRARGGFRGGRGRFTPY